MNETIRRDLPPQTRAGDIFVERAEKEGASEEVQMTWTTGGRVKRGGFFAEPYWEELSLDPKHVRLERFKDGISLLDSHRSYGGIESVLGIAEKPTLSKDGGRAAVRFSTRDVGQAAEKDVRAKILKHVSVGYRIHKLEEAGKGEDGLKVLRATDWEPMEISIVPIGADPGAGFRSENAQANACEIILTREEPTMETTTAALNPQKPAPADAAREEAARVEATQQREAAVKAERERGGEIRKLATRFGMDDAFVTRHIEGGTELKVVRDAILEELEKKQPKITSRVHVEQGDLNETDTRREAMVGALLHRFNPAAYKIDADSPARQFTGMSLMEMARASLEAQGVKTRGLALMEVAAAALGQRAISPAIGTSDFPIVLANVANKTLRSAYTATPQTFKLLARRVTLRDYKPVYRVQMGEAPKLLKINEHGEYRRGTTGEGQEQYKLSDYGRILAFTRQLLINDDMDAFSRIPASFGASAMELESDLFWEQVTTNPDMADGEELFSAAHGNLATPGAVISVTSIGAARAAMRRQTGLAGERRINVSAKYLVVPPALETVADQFVSTALLATATGDINVFAGRLAVLSEPRLEDTELGGSLDDWFLWADPAMIDTFEYAYLEGEEGPQIETRNGWDVDGVEIKCRHTFAVKPIDHRGVYKNEGGTAE